ncbi:MAG: hypothetical protein ABI373_06280 [Flavobacteriales bacterium]
MKTKHMEHYQQEMLDWYSGSGKWAGTPFDPTHLVELARVKYAHAPRVAEALARCTRIWQKHSEYTYCIDPRLREGRVIGHITLPIPDGGCWLVDLQALDVVHGFERLSSDPDQWVWQDPQPLETAPASMTVVHWSKVPKACPSDSLLRDGSSSTDSLHVS